MRLIKAKGKAENFDRSPSSPRLKIDELLIKLAEA